jgi:hypothetical protein
MRGCGLDRASMGDQGLATLFGKGGFLIQLLDRLFYKREYWS